MLDLAGSGVSSATLKKGMKRGRPAETLVIPRNSWTADPRRKRVMVSCARSNRTHHDFRRSRDVPGSSVAPRETCPSARDPAPSHRSNATPKPAAPARRNHSLCGRHPKMRAQDDAHQSGLESATHPLPFGERGSVRIPSPHLRVVRGGRVLPDRRGARIQVRTDVAGGLVRHRACARRLCAPRERVEALAVEEREGRDVPAVRPRPGKKSQRGSLDESASALATCPALARAAKRTCAPAM